jgi:hypothetical protein
MIYTPHGSISRRILRKAQKTRLGGEQGDRDDLSKRLESGAKRARIRHESPPFYGAILLPRGANRGFSRKISHGAGQSRARQRGDINKSAEI